MLRTWEGGSSEFDGGLESIHGGLKSVLKNMGWEGLHSLVKLAAIKKKKKLYGPFLWMGFNCLRLQPLRGGSLLFTTKFPEIPGTHFIGLPRMKG